MKWIAGESGRAMGNSMMAVVTAAAVEQTHAAWVGAGGSIAAVVVALLVFVISIFSARRQRRAVVEETKQAVTFIVGRCVEEYRAWATSVTNSARDRLLEETISLRHLDVPLERLLPAQVGNVKYNRALIAMRKINADVFVQIEKAKKLLEAAGPAQPAPNLSVIAAKLDDFVRRAEEIQRTLVD